MASESPRVNVKALRLAINTLRRAEEDYLSAHVSRKLRASARAYLFGIKESPLPQVCKVLGINVSAARLLLLQWRAQGKTGDPLFGYLCDPYNVVRAEHGILPDPPNFEDLYGNSSSKKGRSSKNSKSGR